MKPTSHRFNGLFALLLLVSFSLQAQVGIGTTTPNPNALLELDASTNVGGLLLPRLALSGSNTSAPLATHVQGMMVFNTATAGDVSPGIYYNHGSGWVRMEGEDSADSVSLSTDIEISSSTYTNISGMSLSFTARKSSVLVLLTASGFGYTNSMSYVSFRINDVTSGSTSIGGTMTKIQSYDDVTGTVTPWSASFSKSMSGLTIGTTYTLQLQGFSQGILGTPNAVIFTSSFPDDCHLTMSVIQ